MQRSGRARGCAPLLALLLGLASIGVASGEWRPIELRLGRRGPSWVRGSPALTPGRLRSGLPHHSIAPRCCCNNIALLEGNGDGPQPHESGLRFGPAAPSRRPLVLSCCPTPGPPLPAARTLKGENWLSEAPGG